MAKIDVIIGLTGFTEAANRLQQFEILMYRFRRNSVLTGGGFGKAMGLGGVEAQSSLENAISLFSKLRKEGVGFFESLSRANKFDMDDTATGIGQLFGAKAPGTLLTPMVTKMTKLLALVRLIALPILAIVVAVKLMGRIFTLNIGGIQTKWFRLIGDIKSALGQFNAWLNRTLQSLGPLIDTILTPIFNHFRFIFQILVGVAKIFGAVLAPIARALGNIGRLFGFAFNTTAINNFNSVINTTKDIFEGIAKAIEAVLDLLLLNTLFGDPNTTGSSTFGSQGIDEASTSFIQRGTRQTSNVIHKGGNSFTFMSNKDVTDDSATSFVDKINFELNNR